jgi:hypothetical protein
MSGGRNNGRGGRGRGGRGGRSRGRGQNYTGSSNAARKGMCANLGNTVFEYGQKSAADQIHTSWEKLAQNVGTNYGRDISNELQNKITVILVEPVQTDDVILKDSLRENTICNGQMNIQRARKDQETILEAAVQAGLDMEALMKLALLQNEIAQGEFSANVEVPIVLNDSQRTQFSNEWRIYREHNDNLIKHRGYTFSLIQGQCTQLLQDKMKQDTELAVVSTSYDPLTLYHSIERTILAQTEDQYPFATVYDQELLFHSFKQETILNPQWYERFNTKVDVSEAIGVTRQHNVILDYVAQESYTKSFEGCEWRNRNL